MFITIADLWESLNISQSIPQNSPIIDSPLLNVPLSFFRTEEYLNLLILLYLYSHHLIDDFNIIHQEKFIGKISFDQIQLFYSAIREAIKPALINSLHKVENKEPIKTPNNASQWINKAQITQYTQVFYKSIYMTLSKYTQLHVSMTTNPFLCRIFYNSDNNSI
ncbi:MAG: hypothetical protein PSV35_07625, partial [bacterium]|nr:hypothetical protein [bacterium]